MVKSIVTILETPEKIYWYFRITFYLFIARFCLFHEGRTSVRDRVTKGGQLRHDLNNGGKCWNFVSKDRKVKLEEVSNKFSTSKVSEYSTCMRKVSARWVPRQLSEDQKVKIWPYCHWWWTVGSLCRTWDKSSIKAVETSWFCTSQ